MVKCTKVGGGIIHINFDLVYRGKFSPLPETADELCEVGRRLGVPNSEILLGSLATESALKTLSEQRRLAEYAIVHFATHGALSGQVHGVAEPGLVLTPPQKGTSDPKTLERDDGFLTASEISTLTLDADWVVLSACNTAGANGEALKIYPASRGRLFMQVRERYPCHTGK